MHNYLTDRRRTILTLSILVGVYLAIAGCTPPAEDTTENLTSTASSALIDNPAPENANFDNFVNHTVSIDPRQYALRSDRIFLKLAYENGDLIYLGEISPYKRNDFVINLPVDQTEVSFQLFSTSSSDDIIFGRITL